MTRRATMKPSSISSISFTLAAITSQISANNQSFVKEENSIWYDVGEVTGLLLKSCSDAAVTPKTGMKFSDVFQNCLRRKGLLVSNRSLKADVISIGNGIQLVKYRDANLTQSDRFNRGSSRFIRDQVDWNNEVSQRFFDLFDTHESKIDLGTEEDLQGRRGRRRKDNMMVSLLVFAMIAVGSIVIPMGFQFLAVLGGKASSLAKSALILSSIQGLKKIATSSFNYGLYSSHSAPPNPWHYDRKWTQQPSTSYDPAHGGYYSSHEPYRFLLQPRIDEEN